MCPTVWMVEGIFGISLNTHSSSSSSVATKTILGTWNFNESLDYANAENKIVMHLLDLSLHTWNHNNYLYLFALVRERERLVKCCSTGDENDVCDRHQMQRVRFRSSWLQVSESLSSSDWMQNSVHDTNSFICTLATLWLSIYSERENHSHSKQEKGMVDEWHGKSRLSPYKCKYIICVVTYQEKRERYSVVAQDSSRRCHSLEMKWNYQNRGCEFVASLSPMQSAMFMMTVTDDYGHGMNS